ncbi:hypothetical protein [Sphingomonas sp.]|uniref:hypothetical protein n=1 Tax=Sphingomonas sp. TaxID=28214 RepID=UPI0035C83412
MGEINKKWKLHFVTVFYPTTTAPLRSDAICSPPDHRDWHHKLSPANKNREEDMPSPLQKTIFFIASSVTMLLFSSTARAQDAPVDKLTVR